jgi:hypothetical protein
VYRRRLDPSELVLRREEGWDDVARSVFRPARPGLPTVLEQAYGLSPEQAQRAVAAETSSDESNARPLLPPQQILERMRRRGELLEDLRTRALAPELAWDRLAPKDWAGDARRWFVGEKVPRGTSLDEPTLSVAWTSWVLRREPPSLDYFTTLCADPDGVALAEDLAREACRRMSRWGCGEPSRVIWLAEEDVRLFDYHAARPFRALADEMLGLAFTEYASGPDRRQAGEWRREMLLFAKRDVVRANAWPAGPGPNPFEPVVAIWRLGYALSAVLDDGAVLSACAPKLGELLGEDAGEP